MMGKTFSSSFVRDCRRTELTGITGVTGMAGVIWMIRMTEMTVMTRVSGMTGMNRIDRMTAVWHKIFAGSNFCVFCNFSSDLQK